MRDNTPNEENKRSELVRSCPLGIIQDARGKELAYVYYEMDIMDIFNVSTKNFVHVKHEEQISLQRTSLKFNSFFVHLPYYCHHLRLSKALEHFLILPVFDNNIKT